jgi:hypothetical protein
MPTFMGNNGAFTPSTSSDIWVLDADGAGEFGKVISIGWGGRLTTSTGYRTRWFRPTGTATSTQTSLNPERANGTMGGTPLLFFGTYATNSTPSTDPKNLHAQDWNAHGGLGYVVLPLANPWWVTNGSTAAQQIACRNAAGVDASGSSYSLTWEE